MTDGELLVEKDDLDVTYEFKADDIRFDFTSGILSHRRDSGIGEQSGGSSVAASETDEDYHSAGSADEQVLVPTHTLLGIEFPAGFIEEHCGSEQLSDTEVKYNKAKSVFSRKKRALVNL